MLLHQIRVPRTCLNRDEERSVARDRYIAIQLPLKKLPDENGSATLHSHRDDIADKRAAKSRGELRTKIANLIGVWKQDQLWVGLADQGLQRGSVAVGRVVFEQVVLDGPGLNCFRAFGRGVLHAD